MCFVLPKNNLEKINYKNILDNQEFNKNIFFIKNIFLIDVRLQVMSKDWYDRQYIICRQSMSFHIIDHTSIHIKVYFMEI